MCINPSNVWVERGPKWELQPVPCRQCWRCKQNRVNDFIGRCMAEASVSQHSCCVTLTYAPRDDLADKVVTPYHFQLFMKLLRRAGHKVRYLVAGEYGDLKDRAHFHAILFFSDLRPLPEGVACPAYNRPAPFCRQIPNMEMLHIKEWPHGHVKVDWSISERSIRYVCEYVLLDKKTGWLSMSKKPPLGAAFFAEKAAKAVQFDVMPSGFQYVPPGGTKGKRYVMTGATRRDYLKAIADQLQPKDTSLNEWVLKSLEKVRRWAFLRELPTVTTDEFCERLGERLESDHLFAQKLVLSAELDHLLYEFTRHQEFDWPKGVWVRRRRRGKEDWSYVSEKSARYAEALACAAAGTVFTG